MLGWFAGPSRTQDTRAGEDSSADLEPPETPAPLFAVRAFKTALFGTPATDRHDERNEHKSRSRESLNEKKVTSGQAGETQFQDQRQEADALRGFKTDALLSPTKGILLTPGTATTRRKTVTFGGLVNNQELQACPSQGAVDNQRIAEHIEDPWAKGFSQADQRPQTTLTKTLFRARGSKANAKSEDDVGEPANLAGLPVDTGEKPKLESEVATTANDTKGPDVTLDLKEPHSQSGQHWKAQFERYYEHSEREMRRLIKKNKSVRKYASKKDSEAMAISEKLKQELSRAASMEAKVSELAVRLSAADEGDQDARDQTEILRKLTVKTASAVKHKQRAEKAKAALRSQDSEGTSENSYKKDARSSPLDAALNNGTKQTLESQEAQRDTPDLLSEIESIKGRGKIAEEKAEQLELENEALKRTVLRVKDEMEKFEVRRKARDEKQKQKFERLKIQNRGLSSQLVKHDENQGQTTEIPGETRDNYIESLKKEVVELKSRLSEASQGNNLDVNDWQRQQRKVSQEMRMLKEELRKLQIEKQEVQASINTTSAVAQLEPSNTEDRTSKTRPQLVDIWSDEEMSDMPNPEQSAVEDLQGIHFFQDAKENGVKEHDLHTEPKTLDAPNLRGISQRSLAHGSLDTTTVATQPSLNDRNSPLKLRHKTKASILSSPRPSIINLSSTPAKPSTSDFPPHDTCASQNVTVGNMSRVGRNSSAFVAGSRASSMLSGRGRASLPPDRIAAAKQRLERRSAEKRQSLFQGKENSRA